MVPAAITGSVIGGFFIAALALAESTARVARRLGFGRHRRIDTI